MMKTNAPAAMLATLSMLAMAASLFSPATIAAGYNELLPVAVISHPDRQEIRKIYELSTETDPAGIPLECFERDGITFSCTDILREVLMGNETQAYSKSETIESSSNDTDTVLGLLPSTKDIRTGDGFSGTLLLDPASIKTEVAGYGSRTRSITTKRSYPNLSAADIGYIPKTVTEDKKTYTLEDVQWQHDSTYNTDDFDISDRYTATATYGGTETVSYVKGYTVTAKYHGEISRSGITAIRYTVIFTGTAVAASEATPTDDDSPRSEPCPRKDMQAESRADPPAAPKPTFVWLYIALPLVGLLLGAGAALLFICVRKDERTNEKDYCDNHGAYSDNGDGPPGSGA